jgi:hypothetical protein
MSSDFLRELDISSKKKSVRILQNKLVNQYPDELVQLFTSSPWNLIMLTLFVTDLELNGNNGFSEDFNNFDVLEKIRCFDVEELTYTQTSNIQTLINNYRENFRTNSGVAVTFMAWIRDLLLLYETRESSSSTGYLLK